MDTTNNNDKLPLLLNAVERTAGQRMATPRHFEQLSECVFGRTRQRLSVSTLKRLWGYVPNSYNPSLNTLNVLSQFAGYGSWKHFADGNAGDAPASNPILARKINVMHDLRPGRSLRLTWMPQRVCVVCYLGEMQFRVTESENTRLQPGDTFSCGLIIAGEPLYLDNLRQAGRQPSAYVCGQVNGVQFELLPPVDKQNGHHEG